MANTKKGKPSAKSNQNKKKSSQSQKKNSRAEVSLPQDRSYVRPIMVASFLALAILFIVIFINPEGAAISLMESLIFGLIGKTAFIVSIPVLIYLAAIYAFSGKRPVTMRTVCLVSFVFLCGCLSHLIVDPACSVPLKELYGSGVSGETGGIVCGGIALLIHWLFGPVVPYILLGIGIALTLLGGMQITIPSIYRAIQNRPRAEWENEEVEEQYADPASTLVDHIATKRIQRMEERRQRKQEEQIGGEKIPAVKRSAPLTEDERVDEIVRQIADVDEPVGVSGNGSAADADVEIIPFPKAGDETIPEKMPPLIPDVPVQTGNTASIDIPVNPVSSDDVKKKKVSAKEAEQSAAEVAMEVAEALQKERPAYVYPPLDLLKLPPRAGDNGTGEMETYTKLLNEALKSFKIDAQITDVVRGPSITRYDAVLGKGVRLSRIASMAEDIALSLGVRNVRIAAVEGKISVVGIEVPNKMVAPVSLREVLSSPKFKNARQKSTFCLGKNISGECVTTSVESLTHLLIAGTTGSGKSVCVNSMIISLLYKANPDEVKLIMIDPKMVEFGAYEGIPHLLIPVVTDPKKAAGSLQWAVVEMMRRYSLMKEAGVRDLKSYNESLDPNEEAQKKLPLIVVVIDELADLMIAAAKEVEESICRIAQMGRASGIHLVIATQRPSADVITGLMKANIPSRIALSVSSAMESRIILDAQGAEKLVGKGDMLFSPASSDSHMRIQGCYVSDPEVEAVVGFVKDNYNVEYDQKVIEEIEKNAVKQGNGNSGNVEASSEELAGDELYPAAVDVILEIGQASVSMLQRRLKLGYARAARIVDEMETKGILGPYESGKGRPILITKEQWEAIKSGNPLPPEEPEEELYSEFADPQEDNADFSE